MHLDIERYRRYVDVFEISEERKVEHIQIVARIMQSFVDCAFGDASEQILLGIDRARRPTDAVYALDSLLHLATTFNDAAVHDAAEKSRQ